MGRRTNHIGAINQESPLFVIKETGSALINNEAARQRTKGGKNCSSALFAELNTGEQAAATNGVCRLGECALLQGCASRLKCGEPPSERRCLCFGGSRRSLTFAHSCAGSGGARFGVRQFTCRRRQTGGRVTRGSRSEHQNALGSRRIFARTIGGNGGALSLQSLKTSGKVCTLNLAGTLSTNRRVATPLARPIGERLELAACSREIGVEDLERRNCFGIDSGCRGSTERLHGCDLSLSNGNLCSNTLNISGEGEGLSLNAPVGTLGDLTRLTRHFKGSARSIKIGAREPKPLTPTMRLVVGIPQLFANGLQLTRDG
jgi:hypothetical protein